MSTFKCPHCHTITVSDRAKPYAPVNCHTCGLGKDGLILVVA